MYNDIIMIGKGVNIMTYTTKLDGLIAVADKLSSDYQRAINLETDNRSKASTTEVVIKEKARRQFKKDGSPTKGRSFVEAATDAFMKTDFMKDKSAKNYKVAADTAAHMAETIENNLVRTNALIRSASYWANIKEVDTHRMTSEARRNQDALPKEIINDLRVSSLIIDGKNRAKAKPGDIVHSYKTTYNEHEELRTGSTLENEPEDLDKVLKYIEGYPASATMHDVFKDQSVKGNQVDTDVLIYLGKISANQKNLTPLIGVSEVEAAVLNDARDAGLQVEVVEKKATDKQLDTTVQEDRVRHEKYQRTLTAAALELSTSNDKTSFDKLPVVSDNIKSIHKTMGEQKIANNSIGDIRSYIHAEAKKEGISDSVSKIEAYGKANQLKTKNQLSSKEREAAKNAELDGGRKIGESRPGANSRFGY